MPGLLIVLINLRFYLQRCSGHDISILLDKPFYIVLNPASVMVDNESANHLISTIHLLQLHVVFIKSIEQNAVIQT